MQSNIDRNDAVRGCLAMFDSDAFGVLTGAIRFSLTFTNRLPDHPPPRPNEVSWLSKLDSSIPPR